MFIKLLKGVSDVFSNYFSTNGNKIDHFGPISDINIFVGANNSGKSRFIRELIKMKEYIINAESENIRLLKELIELCDTIILQIGNLRSRYNLLNLNRGPIGSHIKPLQELSVMGVEGQYNLDKKYFEDVKNSFENIYSQVNNDDNNEGIKRSIMLLVFQFELLIHIVENYSGNISSQYFYLDNIENVIRYKTELMEFVNKARGFVASMNLYKKSVRKIYVPVLRTANIFYILDKSNSNPKLHEDVYSITIKNLYDLVNDDKLEIFTGTNLYETLKKDTLHPEKNARNKLSGFKVFLGDTFFSGKQVNLISTLPDLEKDQLIKVDIEAESERELHNLGDGINSIIVLMYKIFMAEKGDWIFIEEPELNLHPGFQRIFLDTIIKNKAIKEKNLIFFISTHSNHLLDISILYPNLISIFTFEKKIEDNKEQFYIDNVHTSDLKLLNLLGVNNASVFIANCNIWVEGITDRKYIQIYLDAYYNSGDFDSSNPIFKEDIHYSFLEYAGTNIEHYVFGDNDQMNGKIKAQFLSNRIFLLADKDKDKDAKHKKRASKIGLNFEYRNTIVKEIENLISGKVLKQILPKLTNSITNEYLKNVIIDESDYKDIGLGKYLSKKFKGSISNNISLPSGTLSQYYKDKLPDLVAEVLNWDNMSKNSKILIKSVYDFIKKHNH